VRFKGFGFCGLGTRHAAKVPLSCEVFPIGFRETEIGFRVLFSEFVF